MPLGGLRGITRSLWIAISVVLLIIGVGAGYAIGTSIAPSKVVTEYKTLVTTVGAVCP